MIIIISSISIILAICILNQISSYKSYKEGVMHTDKIHEGNEKTLNNSQYPSTSQIILNTLQAIGCQPELNDDTSIHVLYQGENFEFNFNDSRYTRVWDPYWASIKQDSPDFHLIREAVNISNFNFGPTIVMTKPDENNVVSFHSRFDIMIHPACPDNDQYMKSVLDSFFSTKEAVRANFHNLNEKHAEKLKNRRPIGFQKTS